ncbi:MAG: hypothetical protein ABI623_05515 [bacterium]
MAKVKKTNEFEYRLTIAPHVNERRQIPTVLITIETMKAFASFRYELSVQEKRNGKKILYTILGLKTPQLSLPASGTAQFIQEYDDLKGKHTIEVESLDGTTNEFTVNFTQKKMKVLSSPQTPFIELVVA